MNPRFAINGALLKGGHMEQYDSCANCIKNSSFTNNIDSSCSHLLHSTMTRRPSTWMTRC